MDKFVSAICTVGKVASDLGTLRYAMTALPGQSPARTNMWIATLRNRSGDGPVSEEMRSAARFCVVEDLLAPKSSRRCDHSSSRASERCTGYSEPRPSPAQKRPGPSAVRKKPRPSPVQKKLGPSAVQKKSGPSLVQKTPILNGGHPPGTQKEKAAHKKTPLSEKIAIGLTIATGAGISVAAIAAGVGAMVAFPIIPILAVAGVCAVGFLASLAYLLTH